MCFAVNVEEEVLEKMGCAILNTLISKKYGIKITAISLVIPEKCDWIILDKLEAEIVIMPRKLQ